MKLIGWLTGLIVFTSIWTVVTRIGFIQLIIVVLIVNTLGFLVRKNLK